MSEPVQDSLFHIAFAHAAIGMALVSPEGRWLSVNRSICEIVGYAEEELRTLTFQQITHADDLNIDLAFLEQLSQGKISNYHMEKRYIHRAGHIIWAHLSVSAARHEDGTPRFFISQIQDITARKEAEAMRESLFQLPLTLHFVMGADGFFKKLSPSWTDVLGDPLEHLLQHPMHSFVHPDDVERTLQEIENVTRGNASLLFENRFRCADGSYRWLLWTSTASPDQRLVYGVAFDFTVRKGLELNLRLALEDRERLIRELETAARQNKQLRDQLVTICAWTNRIFHDGRWMSTDEFLGNYLGLNLTHGISEEGKALFYSQGPAEEEQEPLARGEGKLL